MYLDFREGLKKLTFVTGRGGPKVGFVNKKTEKKQGF